MAGWQVLILDGLCCWWNPGLQLSRNIQVYMEGFNGSSLVSIIGIAMSVNPKSYLYKYLSYNTYAASDWELPISWTIKNHMSSLYVFTVSCFSLS